MNVPNLSNSCTKAISKNVTKCRKQYQKLCNQFHLKSLKPCVGNLFAEVFSRILSFKSLHVLILAENNEVKTSYAERLFFNNEFHQCYVRTKEILKSDPMFKPTLMLHISVLGRFSYG